MFPDIIFTTEGYRKIITEYETIVAYFCLKEECCTVIVEIDYRDTQKVSKNMLDRVLYNIEQFLLEQDAKDIHKVFLVDTYSRYVAAELMSDIEPYWVYDTYMDKLEAVFDVEPYFEGIYLLIQDYLAYGIEYIDSMKEQKKRFSWRKAILKINNLIILINVLVFVWLEVQGNTLEAAFMLDHGALHWPYVEIYGEWYRVISSMFMHFGILHLFSNMFLLFFIGETVERIIGRCRYVLLYMVSGIAANLISCFYYAIYSPVSVCCGASGAIFGVAGGLLYLVLANKGNLEGLTVRRMILFVFLSVYSGVEDSSVNMVAHISGLIVGFLMAVILYRKNKMEA